MTGQRCLRASGLCERWIVASNAYSILTAKNIIGDGVSWGESGEAKKMAPCLGAIFSSLLVVPVTVTFNDYCSVTILIVPAAMVPTVMSIELGARAAIVITVVISIASESEAETLGARYCGRCNRDGR
jgi:hypothetical protein